MSWTKVMTSCPLFQNAFILKGSRVANFADIIKNASTFSEKVIELKLCITM